MTAFPTIELPDDLALAAAEVPGLNERLVRFIRAEVSIHRKKQRKRSPEVLEAIKKAQEEVAARGPLSEEEKAQAKKDFVAFYEELVTQLK
jgi:hypothetical protein